VIFCFTCTRIKYIYIKDYNWMNEILIRHIQTPAGVLILGSFQDKLCLCDWKYRKMRDRIDMRIQSLLKGVYTEGNSTVIEETVSQLMQYFRGNLQVFNLSLLPVGTEFQKNVWQELMKIPYGETSTYGRLAEKLGDIRAVRAVAAANGANAISIIVPCHRVIGKQGELVGYAGGIDAKRKLLNLENSTLLQRELFQ